MSERKKKVIDLITEAAKKGKYPEKKETTGNIAINNTAVGDIAVANCNGNVYINKRETKRVIIEPSPDDITPAQAFKIKEKIDELVKIGVIAGGENGLLYRKWWTRLQKRFLVNSYLKLQKNEYESVITWLNQQIAMSLPKIRRKDNVAWRKNLYKSIWSKVKYLGFTKEWVYQLIYDRLGKNISSLTELGEQDLAKLNNIINGIKRN